MNSKKHFHCMILIISKQLAIVHPQNHKTEKPDSISYSHYGGENNCFLFRNPFSLTHAMVKELKSILV